jgi:neutral ceramidase
MSPFLAGVSRADITPPIGIAHGNWSAQGHERAEGIDLPMFCTVLAASDGVQEIILAEWELLYPPSGEWLIEARKRITDLTGVPASHIRLSATHTHAGPSLRKPWFEAGAEMVEPYIASLNDRLAGAALAAHRNLKPARVAGGYGTCAVNNNRRRPWKEGADHFANHPFYLEHQDQQLDPILMSPYPEGFSDHQVGVIRIDDATSSDPIAILVNFAAHPTIMAWDNRLLSPDYPGTVRRVVENIVGGTCLFLQGAAGNQDTIRDYMCRSEDARWVGKQIGIEAARVASLIETQPMQLDVSKHVESSWTMGVGGRIPNGESDGTVRAVSRVIPLPAWHRSPPTQDEIENVTRLERELADLRAQGAPDSKVRAANMRVRRSALNLSVNKKRSAGTEIPLEFQALRLGNTALVGIPVEPFAEIGVAVKEASPFATTFFSGYTNGAEYYMPMPYAYQEGGYEVWMSPFAPQAAEKTIEVSVELLKEIAT